MINVCHRASSLNNSVLNSFLKTDRLMPGLRRCLGREFQALGQATMKARGPIVNVWHAGTRTSPEAAERRCDRPVTRATGVHSMARYRGAESFRQRKARSEKKIVPQEKVEMTPLVKSQRETDGIGWSPRRSGYIATQPNQWVRECT